MREILFRGLCNEENAQNGKWKFGFYTRFNGCEHRIYSGYADTDCGDYYPDWCSVDPDTLGQYTGKCDKNGTKIFDGDIVKTKYGRICKVVLFQPTMCWDLEPVSNLDCKAPDEYNLWNSENLEVIGNVYDNTDLLEDKK